MLNSSEDKYSKFATKKWYIIDRETKGSYSHHDPIKFLTGSLELNLCDYSDAYILVTGDIAVKRRNATDIADIHLFFFISMNKNSLQPRLCLAF